MIKQVIVLRTKYEKDGKPFKPRSGKMMAQACHASMKFFAMKLKNETPLSEVEKEWLIHQKFTKIILKVETEEELFTLGNLTNEAGLTSYLVEDCGETEFDGPTFTAIGIGPDEAEKIDPITKHLKLY